MLNKMKKRNIEEEIQNLDSLIRDNDKIHPKLRGNLLKQLEIVRKCAKPRRSNKGNNYNLNSGLLKPVMISEEMASFANWPSDALHSRVDVTNAICVYIKNNMLQKKENKRTIIPDQILTNLLSWDPKAEEMHVSAVNASDRIFKIIQNPKVGLKDLKYYQSSELRKNGREVNIVKSIKSTNDGGEYVFTLKNEDHEIKNGDVFVLHVPLTYPKIQTKIGTHLIKPKIEVVPIADPTPAKPKKKKEPKKT
jgi:hypothetical protein